MHFSFPCHRKRYFFLGCGVGLKICGFSSDFPLPIVSFSVRKMLAYSLFCSRWCSKPVLGNVWNLSQSRQGACFQWSHSLRGDLDVPKSATWTLGNIQQQGVRYAHRSEVIPTWKRDASWDLKDDQEPMQESVQGGWFAGQTESSRDGVCKKRLNGTVPRATVDAYL